MSQPPPQLSPDGRYYWDGERWAPMPQTEQMTPYSQASAAPPQAVVVYQPRTSSLAIASLVSGIVAWFLCPIVGGIVAVICGHVAQSQIRQTGEGGSGLAIAGLVLGYINILIGAVILLIWLSIFGGLLALLATVGTAAPTPSP